MALPGGVRLIDIPRHADARGDLFAMEQDGPLPFQPLRVFVIADVPLGAHRARHNTPCEEFLWVASGACTALLRADGVETGVSLERRGPGLYVPKGTWLELRDFAPESILICVASTKYDPDAHR